MKTILFISALLFMTSLTFAQDLEQFYMPQLQSKEDCDKYIGKRVCTFDYSSPSNKRWSDSQKFDEYRTELIIYTITKIKFGKQIELLLTNGSDIKKVKVNNGAPVQNDELSSCNVFFLCDNFDAYKNKLVGTVYKNINNEDVAILENLELCYRVKEDPILVSTLKSLINEEVFLCFYSEIGNLCKNIGVVITNPNVKSSYRVLSGHTVSLNSEIYDEKCKYIFAKEPYYIYENLTNGETNVCSAKSILTAPFKEDLSGKYISLLAKVEKPSNSEIRYGETTTVLAEDGISKFSYKDNVIDIMIFADCSKFNFVLQNISDNSIKIVWDEAVFVNFDGSIERVMHKGIKFSEKNGPQPATTIIKGAKWEDIVIPTHLVYYREATSYVEGGWDTYSMYPKQSGLMPGQIKLMLPIQIKDVINEYVFVFNVQYVFNHPERLSLRE